MNRRSTVGSRKRRGGALTLKTLNGGTVAVDSSAIEELRRGLKGDVVVDAMPAYDEVRRVWNAAIDRRPAVIVRCVDVQDIVHAVRFAERHDALISVRGGGHNAAGFAISDSGLVIDLTRLRSVVVDSARRTARVGGGATFADYDAATHAHGLASTGPIISMVGVGGYTLGGADHAIRIVDAQNVEYDSAERVAKNSSTASGVASCAPRACTAG